MRRLVLATLLVLALVAGAGCTEAEQPNNGDVTGDVREGEVKTFYVEQKGRTYFCILKKEPGGTATGLGLWCDPVNGTQA